MQHTDLKAGNFYTAKVTGKTVTVRLLTIRSAAKYRGNNDSAATHYDVQVMDTGKKVVFRSPSRFLKEVAPPAVKEVAGKGGENSSDPTKTSRPKTRPSSGSTPRGRARASTGASSRDTAAAESAVKSEVDRPNAAPSSAPSLDLARRLRTEAQPVQVSGQHLIVAALAGTGKTTTLVEGLKFMRGQPTAIKPSLQQKAIWDAMVSSRNARFVCCCAFNKTIAEELQSRVPEGVDVMTMHSMGFRAVRRAFKDVQKDDFRVVNIIGELTNQDVRHLRNTRPVFLSSTTQLVNLVKQNLIPTDIECLEDRDGVNSCLQELADYYDVMLEDPEYGGEGNITEEVFELVPKIIDRCKEVARDNKIDFTDMIWLPIALGLPVFQYDLLLGDECLPGWTPVMLADGTSETIKNIVESNKEFVVRAYDTKTKEPRNCRVVAKQRLLNQKPLVQIKTVSNHKKPYKGRMTGGNRLRNFVVCTIDHKIWTDNRGWVEAGKIVSGDVVVIETAAQKSQTGKIGGKGRANLASLQNGNKRGLGSNTNRSAAHFNLIKGGNGRGPTLAESTLLNALGSGWVWNLSVKTKGHESCDGVKFPTHYKLDVANPSLKICVEVDGASHRTTGVKDNRKTRFLESMGWKVIRVSNRRAIQQTSDVVCEITGNCPALSTVVEVGPVSIRDNYVYDITVEDCHNFYANGILVHNCQDWNRCQQALAKKAGKRLVLCGDVNQAIYGFAGADCDSIPRLTKELSNTSRGCITLPLTVTRRCGKAIVKEAQTIVPSFEAHDSAPEGVIYRDVYDREAATAVNPHYATRAESGDMVICRVNAPLVSQCFMFLRSCRKANIIGRDIAKGLTSLINKLVNPNDTVDTLVTAVEEWLEREMAKENKKKNPSDTKLIMLDDKAQCILTFCDEVTQTNGWTVSAVLARIDSIFSEPTAGVGIRLSSIHRAKGLEAHRVFLLEPKGCGVPHPMARSPWQRKQEYNLRYVALTRAINELVYVS